MERKGDFKFGIGFKWEGDSSCEGTRKLWNSVPVCCCLNSSLKHLGLQLSCLFFPSDWNQRGSQHVLLFFFFLQVRGRAHFSSRDLVSDVTTFRVCTEARLCFIWSNLVERCDAMATECFFARLAVMCCDGVAEGSALPHLLGCGWPVAWCELVLHHRAGSESVKNITL